MIEEYIIHEFRLKNIEETKYYFGEEINWRMDGYEAQKG